MSEHVLEAPYGGLGTSFGELPTQREPVMRAPGTEYVICGAGRLFVKQVPTDEQLARAR